MAAGGGLSLALLVGASLDDGRAWPAPALASAATSAASESESQDDERFRRHRLCVATPKRDTAELSDRVVYRLRRDGDRLVASYFFHWSTERPWGDRSVAASLAIDAVYSHLLYVLPGARYFLHGPGDVEGATVVYREAGDGLQALEGFADDERHDATHLGAADLGARAGTALMTRVWSHQLGSSGAAGVVDAGGDERWSVRCFEGADFVRLTVDIAERFRLGSEAAPSRARPAWR